MNPCSTPDFRLTNRQSKKEGCAQMPCCSMPLWDWDALNHHTDATYNFCLYHCNKKRYRTHLHHIHAWRQQNHLISTWDQHSLQPHCSGTMEEYNKRGRIMIVQKHTKRLQPYLSTCSLPFYSTKHTTEHPLYLKSGYMQQECPLTGVVVKLPLGCTCHVALLIHTRLGLSTTQRSTCPSTDCLTLPRSSNSISYTYRSN